MADSDLTNLKNIRPLTIWKKSVFNAKLDSTKIVLQRPKRYQYVIANTVKFMVEIIVIEPIC